MEKELRLDDVEKDEVEKLLVLALLVLENELIPLLPLAVELLVLKLLVVAEDEDVLSVELELVLKLLLDFF